MQKKTPDVLNTRSLVCDLSPIAHAAEGGTQPSASMEPDGPHVEKTPLSVSPRLPVK